MLTAAFNRMLDRIQEHDHALRAVNQNLEVEVAERQRKEQELSESRQRFEVAVMGSSVGLWDWKLPTNELYFSPRWKNMIGYEDAEIPESVPGMGNAPASRGPRARAENGPGLPGRPDSQLPD